MTKKLFWKITRKTSFITLGVFSASFGLKGFLIPTGFIDGGITGISMLAAHLSSFSLPFWLALINLPFLFLGLKQIHRKFALTSFLSVFGLALCLTFIEFPIVTHDKLLSAVFGGVFLGAGVGLSIRGGGVLDGTEILALILSKKVGATVGDIVLLINIFIFAIAAFFLGLEPAMYSILTYFSASKAIDFLIHGFEEYYSVTVISPRNLEIRNAIMQDMGRPVTIFKGMGGRGQQEQEIIMCVTTRLEIPKLKEFVLNLDPEAFILVTHISEVEGGLVKPDVLSRLVRA